MCVCSLLCFLSLPILNPLRMTANDGNNDRDPGGTPVQVITFCLLHESFEHHLVEEGLRCGAARQFVWDLAASGKLRGISGCRLMLPSPLLYSALRETPSPSRPLGWLTVPNTWCWWREGMCGTWTWDRFNKCWLWRQRWKQWFWRCQQASPASCPSCPSFDGCHHGHGQHF